MKIYIKVFLLFLLPIFLNISFPQNSLKVVTYNIQGMKPGTNPGTRLFYIIQKLKEVNPDIIGIQEVNEDKIGDNSDNQIRRIADSLSAHFEIPYYTYYEQTHEAWDNQYREFIGIISKYPVEEQGFRDLTPGIFPRKVLWNYINTPLGNINFFNTHLSFNSSKTRKIQVDEILDYAGLQTAIKQNVASIITGDFNDIPDSTSIKKFTNVSHLDTYAEVNPSSPGYTIPSSSPYRKIDYIFVNKFTKLNIDTSYIVMDEPYDGINYCSDHLGVVTIFTDTDTTTVGIDIEHGQIIDDFKLFQNYPNPFNPSTTIRYTIPYVVEMLHATSLQTTLKVYDILGNEIVTLINEAQPPGEYEIIFNVETHSNASLPNSIYFYTLTVGDKSVIQKMLLVK